MDLNRFNGTVAQFNAKYGTHIVPIGTVPPIIIPPGTVPEKVVLITNANIRTDPNPSIENIIGVGTMNKTWYPEGTVLDQYGAEWYRFGKKIYIKKELTKPV
jgi:hypothetical protein